MANMLLAGYVLYKALKYYEESEPMKGAAYIGLVILNVVLSVAID